MVETTQKYAKLPKVWSKLHKNMQNYAKVIQNYAKKHKTMHKISPEQFATVCYCFMMGDCELTSYDYMHEQLKVLEEGYNAYSNLDVSKKLKLIEYLSKWSTEVPAEIRRYKIIPDNLVFDILESSKKLQEEKDNDRRA